MHRRDRVDVGRARCPLRPVPPRSRRRSARRARGSRSPAPRRRSARAGRPGSTRPTSGCRAPVVDDRGRGLVARRLDAEDAHVTSASAARTTVVPGTAASSPSSSARVLGSVDLVRPHDQRVLAGVGVVALAHADRLEAEPPVHLLRALVRQPDLERERRRSARDRLAREREQQPRADAVAVPRRDRRRSS